MFKLLFKVLILFIISNYLAADSHIIKEGQIIISKPYSLNETTLIVNNSNKIYICSIVDRLTKCILSDYRNKLN